MWSHELQHQASLAIINSPSLLKLTSTESVMPSNHLILCCPLSPLPSIFPRIGVFSNESVFRIRWPKYWSLTFSISSSNEYSGLISFRIDWFDLLAIQGTVKSLLQHHSSKASILLRSAFFMVQLSHPYTTTRKAIALTIWTFVDKVTSLLFNTLSRFVIAILPRCRRLLISWLQSPSSVILVPNKMKSDTVWTYSPSICHEVIGLYVMILDFWRLSLSQLFHSLSPSSRGSLVPLYFQPIKWYHVHIWDCWYFSQQSWFQLVIHPAQHFARLHFHKMYSRSWRWWRTGKPGMMQSMGSQRGEHD